MENEANTITPVSLPTKINRRRFKFSVPLELLVVLCYAGLIVAIWLPFGLRTGATYEEWLILARFTITPEYHVYQDRPLLFLPWLIAFFLTPGSFVGLNLTLATLIIAKGFSAFLLIRQLLPKQAMIAFVVGALMMVYPAGAGYFTLRNTHLHLAVTCVIISIYFLVRLRERFQPLMLGMMWAVQAIGFATYETGLPLTVIAPLLLVWLEKRISRRVIRLSGLWLLLPIIFGLLFVKTLTVANSYQTKLLSNSLFSVSAGDTISQFAASIWRVYTEHFWTGWSRIAAALPDATQNMSFIWLAGTATLLCVVPILGFVARREFSSDSPPLDWKRYGWLIAGAAAAIFLGYAVFLPTIWRDSNWRTFYYSTIGAAVCLVLLLFLLSRLFGRFQQIVFILLVAPLIGLGVLNALNEHNAFYEQSQYELQTLAQIIEQAPRLKPGSLLVIMDHPPSRVANWAINVCSSATECIDDALKSIYPDRQFRVVICVDPTQTYYQHQGICRFDQDSITATYFNPAPEVAADETFTYAYDKMSVWDSDAAGIRLLSNIDAYRPAAGRVRYDPSQVIDSSALPPPKVYSMFSRWPFAPLFQQAPLNTLSLHFQPSTMIRGLGWSIPQLVGAPPEGVVWTTATISTLEYWLTPGSSYTIRFSAYNGLAPDILASLTLTVNGESISLESVPDPSGAINFEGHIPREVMVLSQNSTLIAFRINRTLVPKALGINEDARSLGIQFSWIEVVPQTPLQSAKLDLKASTVIPGSGWAAPETVGEPPELTTWTIAQTATLHYWLSAEQDYHIRIRAYPGVTPDILPSLALAVNDQLIPLQASQDEHGATLFEGYFPRTTIALDRSETHFAFTVNRTVTPKSQGINDDDRTLGIRVHWIQIEPDQIATPTK